MLHRRQGFFVPTRWPHHRLRDLVVVYHDQRSWSWSELGMVRGRSLINHACGKSLLVLSLSTHVQGMKSCSNREAVRRLKNRHVMFGHPERSQIEQGLCSCAHLLTSRPSQPDYLLGWQRLEEGRPMKNALLLYYRQGWVSEVVNEPSPLWFL